jgi:hypothetical protein
MGRAASDVWLEDYIVVVPHAGETMISGERYRLRQQERIGTKVREMYAEMSRLSLSPRLRLLVRQIKAHRGAPSAHG